MRCRHLFAAFFFVHFAHAADVVMMIGNNPPINDFNAGKPKGMAVEVVDEMLKRAGLSADYPDYPWARIYNHAQNRANHCAYTVNYLPEREGLFEWVGPIAFNQWAFFALKERKIKLNKLENAHNYRIGGQRKDAKAIWLEARNFTIDYANSESQTLKKLMANKIDLYLAGLFIVDHIAVLNGIEPQRLEPVLVINRVESFIACSPNTDPKIIAKLQSALESMKTDKSLNGIWKKYESKFRAPANG